MSDEQEQEELDPQKSLCWLCKHGMALHEGETQTFMQPGIVPGNPFEGQGDEPGIEQVSLEVQKVRSVCFYNSKLSPLVFGRVTKCSRYEAN